MHILGLDHLVITTENLENCLAFYVDILNMQLDIKNNRYSLYFGKQKINIHRKKAEFLPAAKNVTYGSLDLCFYVEEEIDKIYKEIKEKGWEIELGPIERNGAQGMMKSIYLRDPDGNLIEICSYKKGS